MLTKAAIGAGVMALLVSVGSFYLNVSSMRVTRFVAISFSPLNPPKLGDFDPEKVPEFKEIMLIQSPSEWGI
ncbi:hypothetical protein ACKFKH_32595 [Phormidesmis sp. 146-20]